jgi:ATP-binding cassette, subfamily B, bacterial
MKFMAAERRAVGLANYRPKWYWIGTIGWISWFVSPLGPGWLTSRAFRALENEGASTRFWILVVGLLAAHFGAAFLIFAAHRTYVPGVEAGKALARSNVISAQTASGGREAAARSVPVGDILTRLRDDPFDVMFLVDNWVDFFGSFLFGIAAVIFMARIDPLATLAGVLPMVGIGFANRLVGNLSRRYRQRSRKAASEVGDFLTSAFQASLTVKVGGAQADVLKRFDELSHERSSLAVKDDTWNEVVWTLNTSAADLCVGVALVVAARGSLDTGEISLFASYLVGMVWLPQRVGNILVGRRRYAVSAGRLDELLGDATASFDPLTHHRTLPVLKGQPALTPTLGKRIPLQRLDVTGLSVPSRGLQDISFGLEKGSLTVISGPVGSGKTSLLRAVIGTLEIDSGTVTWNRTQVSDRAEFFVPPQCAYVSQVPKLFADSLMDNLRLGHQLGSSEIAEGIRLAAFDTDVADLPDGMATPIGARGVRLSGGQSQRAAAARAMAQRPELLVLDDLTSALDVETEQELWERLAAAGFTVLAASNRPIALARADQVIQLEA